MSGAGVSAGEFGYNFNLLAVGDWTDPRLASAVAALAPGHLRIPGGTVSDYWDWDRGGLVASPLTSLGLPGTLPYPASIVARGGATFDAVAPAFRTSGAEALFTANIVTSSLDAELARIRQAMGAGLRIRRVEIGNEQYFGDPAYRHLFPTPMAYADAAGTWARAIKAHFPGMQVAVVGILDPAPAVATNDQRVIGWNRALVESGVLDVADAVALHAYGPPPPVPPAERGTPVGAVRLIDGVWDGTAARIGAPALRDLDGDVRFWITEFNLADTATDPMVAGTWLHGLATMGQAMIYLADPRVDVVTQHVLLGEPQWQALVGADGRAVDWSARGLVAAPPLSLTATGETGALVGRATAGGGVAHAFDPTPLDPHDPALGLRIVRPDGSSAVLIANGTAGPVAIDLAGTATILTAVGGDPWSSGLGPDDPVRTVVSLGTGGRLAVPAFGATLAELPSPSRPPDSPT